MRAHSNPRDPRNPPAEWREWSAERLVGSALSTENPLPAFWAREVWGDRGEAPEAAKLLASAWERDPNARTARVVALLARRFCGPATPRTRGLLLDVFRRSADAIQGEVSADAYREHALALSLVGGELGRAGGDEARATLDSALDDPQEPVRVAAANGLAATGDEDAVTAVLHATLDGRVAMQRAASFLASEPAALRALADLESDGHPRAPLLAKELRRQLRRALEPR